MSEKEHPEKPKPNWREGDWNCKKCSAHNFSRRSSCFKCGQRNVDSNQVDKSDENRHPGDWDCPHCFCMNFARRTECFRCKRSQNAMSRQRFTEESPPKRGEDWKDGDWECTEPDCGTHNFAKRRECFRCRAPRNDHSSNRERDYGGWNPYPGSSYYNEGPPSGPPPRRGGSDYITSDYITTDRNSWSSFEYPRY